MKFERILTTCGVKSCIFNRMHLDLYSVQDVQLVEPIQKEITKKHHLQQHHIHLLVGMMNQLLLLTMLLHKHQLALPQHHQNLVNAKQRISVKLDHQERKASLDFLDQMVYPELMENQDMTHKTSNRSHKILDPVSIALRDHLDPQVQWDTQEHVE